MEEVVVDRDTQETHTHTNTREKPDRQTTKLHTTLEAEREKKKNKKGRERRQRAKRADLKAAVQTVEVEGVSMGGGVVLNGCAERRRRQARGMAHGGPGGLAACAMSCLAWLLVGQRLPLARPLDRCKVHVLPHCHGAHSVSHCHGAYSVSATAMVYTQSVLSCLLPLPFSVSLFLPLSRRAAVRCQCVSCVRV